MKGLLVLSTLLVLSLSVNGQVGINTEKPSADLDINGGILFRSAFKVKNGYIDDPGKTGDLLISNGKSANPKWMPISTLVSGNLTYGLVDIIKREHEDGFELLTESPNFSLKKEVSFIDAVNLSPSWDVEFQTKNDSCLLAITMETSALSAYMGDPEVEKDENDLSSLFIRFVGQMYLSSNGGAFKLLTARQEDIKGYRNYQTVFDLIALKDLLPEGNHVLKIVFDRLASDDHQKSHKLLIGRSNEDVPSSNHFMTKSVLRVSVYSFIRE